MRLRRRGLSLRHYRAGFMALLLVVATVAAVAMRGLTEQDARQAAEADANFAARAAASDIANELALLRETNDGLAANPHAAVIVSTPNASCNLTFATGMIFTSGHLDVV